RQKYPEFTRVLPRFQGDFLNPCTANAVSKEFSPVTYMVLPSKARPPFESFQMTVLAESDCHTAIKRILNDDGGIVQNNTSPTQLEIVYNVRDNVVIGPDGPEIVWPVTGHYSLPIDEVVVLIGAAENAE